MCRRKIWYNFLMTDLLERAIAKVRQLPEEEQDAIAIALFPWPMPTHRLSRSMTKRERRFLKDWAKPNAVNLCQMISWLRQ